MTDEALEGKLKEETAKRLAEEIGGKPLTGVDIVVHAMPERFRALENPADKAKKTGIFVLVLGIVFLIAAAILFYFYVFKSKVGLTPDSEINKAATIKPSELEKQPEVVSERDEDTQKEIKPPESTVSEKSVTPTTNIAIPPIDTDAFDALATSSPLATTTEEVSPSATTTPSESLEFKIALDSDLDGLSDKEEILLLSKLESRDSDNDGYEDLAEVLNFYNPAGIGAIEANPAIDKYTNTTFNYNVLYPSAWPINKFGGDDSIMFKSPDSQFIQIIVQPNIDKLTIQAWYRQQFEGDQITTDRLLPKDTWYGVVHKDKLTVYLVDMSKKYIITFTYNLGSSDTAYYRNIFDLMVNSFEIGE